MCGVGEMLLADLKKGRCVIKDTGNRSKDDFLKMTSMSTGFPVDQLIKMDLGDIEEKLKIRAEEPYHSLSMKKGKSANGLYKFYDTESKSNLRQHIIELTAQK